jgi:hypothetical protein
MDMTTKTTTTTRRFTWILLAAFATLHLQITATASRIAPRPRRRQLLWNRPRGGQQEQQKMAPVVMSIGMIHDAGVQLLNVQGIEGTSKQADLPLDAVETVSLVSDFVIVRVCGPNVDAEVVSAIYNAASRRATHGSPKLRLLVVVETGQTSNDGIEEVKEHIVLRELAQFTPSMVESLDVIAGMDHARDIVKETMQEQNPGTTDAPSQLEHDLMVTLIYNSLTSNSCELDWYDADEDWSSIGARSLRPDIDIIADSALELNAHTSMLSHSEADEDDEALAQQILQEVQADIAKLEEQQDEVWTNHDSPLLQFGADANRILTNVREKLPASLQTPVLTTVASQLSTLYRNQLDSLREHYGRRYESVLESTKDQQTWTEEAAQVTDSFRAAAQLAIPAACREGGELVDADFSYVQSLHGLLSDMMEATESRSQVSDILDEMENAPEDDGDVRKKPAKWYEKLAARAFVLGFNYLQGWLAWQGVRRAAAERDRDMPKFPLF